MKKDIISEIKKEQLRVRVLFATSALGMGVDASYVTNIVHITLPSSLEAYMQEIGHAGCTGLSSCATLYYNNSDIGNNKKTCGRINEIILQIRRHLAKETLAGLLWILQCSTIKLLLHMRWHVQKI